MRWVGRGSVGRLAATLLAQPLARQKQVRALTATPETGQHRPPQCLLPDPRGIARHCHLPDRWTQQSFNLKRQGSRRERYASRLPGFLQKLEKASHIFPCLPHPRLFLKLSLPTGTILSAKHKVVHQH